jgi:hypothetical protein
MPKERRVKLELILKPPFLELWEEMREASGLTDEKLFWLAAHTLAAQMEALSDNFDVVIIDGKGKVLKRIVLPGRLVKPFRQLPSLPPAKT